MKLNGTKINIEWYAQFFLSNMTQVFYHLSNSMHLVQTFHILHQFVRSSRRWSNPRCLQCQKAAGPSSNPSEHSDQSGENTVRGKKACFKKR